ncbi:MAG: DEAD/DEAH box helicase [Nitrospiraceae bacterium]|nr:DEAD/DEAH box helicase [Nitrospiraceae bacterium]
MLMKFKKATPKTKPALIKLKVPRTHKPDNLDVEEWQRLLRKQFGEQQSFKLKNLGTHPIFSEFSVTNPISGRTYKVAIRGLSYGYNYCSCPDYSINNLGTCKHVEFVISRLLKKKGAKKAFEEGCVLPYSEVYLSYGLVRRVRFRAGNKLPRVYIPIIKEYFDQAGILRERHLLDFHRFFEKLPKKTGHEVRCCDDVMSFVAELQDRDHRRRVIESHLGGTANNKAFDHLLKTKLYRYQQEGTLFAVKAGRCLIGDDMGLGKTIQAMAAAELMAKLFDIRKVLVISPASLKYQWKSEIEKFTGRSAEVIEGMNHQRRPLYEKESFYKLLNYEIVHRDIDKIKEWSPDLIILDEAQRIKNWKTRTARSVKRLESPFAIVLTGTPIENRIEELHSIMEFIDRYHLGPLYRFVHKHSITDENGKIIGYKDLHSIRDSLKNIMLRRRKAEVLRQLPGRTDKNFFVPLTKEQAIIHEENREIVAKLVAKWKRYRFLSEADQLRLLTALNFMRMSADNTFLVDKTTIHGPKIDELEILLREIVLEGGEKAVIFSQWLKMNELVEHILERNGIDYVHLNGSVPSRQRKGLMTRFREDPGCKVFLSTDAGGVGLNLQSGSVVINMDIPWNPAVLEQRIGRVHRLGQQRKVRVINFVSKGSIEDRMLDLLKFKKSLFTGALDTDGGDVVMMGESRFKRFMKSMEALSDDIPKADTGLMEKIEEEEKANIATSGVLEPIEEMDATKPVAAEPPFNTETLNVLLTSGARLLTDLSKMLTVQGDPIWKRAGSLIERDDNTGLVYAKIPIPETETLKTLFSSLGELLSKALTR